MNSGLKNTFVSARNVVFHFLYKYFLKPILFLFDPEDVHNWFLIIGGLLGRYSILRWKTRLCFGFSDPVLEQTVAGLHFKNPVGLAAGFDKNAKLEPLPWQIAFSYSRALQNDALVAWRGNPEQFKEAQQIFLSRLESNSLADQGR
jgi:hypothetical protein